MQQQIDFPATFACFDTLAKRYITGAKGQYIFDSTGGLKRSIAQRYSYAFAEHKMIDFFKSIKEELALVDEYEYFVQNYDLSNMRYDEPERQRYNEILTDMREMLSGASPFRTPPKPAGKYAKEYAESSFPKMKFKDQDRYVIHSIDSVVVKEVK